jgi:hypothetical protein
MERHGHLRLSVDVRLKLLAISRSSVDRILSLEKDRAGKSISTTKPGNLLKHQIQVRTFADWVDVTPGFLETDLVAHAVATQTDLFWEALSELYRVLRVYVNFFQPSLKLLSKERNGARVSKNMIRPKQLISGL